MRLAKQISELTQVSACPLNQAQARVGLDALLVLINEATAEPGQRLRIPGLGTLERRQRPTRPGRNPRTGEPMVIQARSTLVFRPAKALVQAGDQAQQG